MSSNLIYAILALTVLVVIVALFVRTKKIALKPINKRFYQKKWTQILEFCKTQEGVTLAVIDADKLLDDVLKKRHFKGKTMGERMVDAQRYFSDNDSIWFAHKLRNKLVHETNKKLNKNEAQKALAGVRQGLKDLGAL